MGITTHLFRCFMKEHKFRPLVGRGLLVGRQSVFFSLASMKTIAQVESCPLKDIAIRPDTVTTMPGEILDYDLFRSFCDLEMQAIDISNYEGAEIVHDMNTPLPEHLEGQFDFIFNGSCMDNSFNPGMFVTNISRMLAPKGRVVHIEHGSAWPGAYVSYSPDWFLDYYSVNDWTDCQVFVAEFIGYKPIEHVHTNWSLYRWNPLFTASNGTGREFSSHSSSVHRMILTIAEKGADSKSTNSPVQGVYRAADQNSKYASAYRRFLGSRRVDFYRDTGMSVNLVASNSSNLEYVGRL